MSQFNDLNPFPKAKWTIIFQIASESDLINDMISIYDKISTVGSVLGEVNFIVFYDGIAIEGVPFPGMPSIYYVRPGITFAEDAAFPIRQLTNEDLTNARVFNGAMTSIKNRFPADNWGYFYCGHGAAGGTDITNGNYRVELDNRLIINGRRESEASMRQRLADQYEEDGWTISDVLELSTDINDQNVLVILTKQDNFKSLSYNQLGGFLRTAFNGDLNFICLDSCWGMLTENCLAFMDVADHFVASVDEMPVKGIGYDAFCRLLADNADIKPSELASAITTTFYQANYNDYLSSADFNNMGVSLSCVDLDNFKTTFLQNFQVLVNYLIANMPRLRPVIDDARDLCLDHTYASPNVYAVYNIDLCWFLENLIFYIGNHDPQLVTLSLKVIANIKLYLLKAFVANNYKENDVQAEEEALGGYGFTICFPTTEHRYGLSIYSDDVMDKHGHLHSGWIWKNFLKSYLRIGVPAAAYAKLFTSGGKYHNYASYFTKAEGDKSIVAAVNKFVEKFQSTEAFTGNVIKNNKWAKVIERKPIGNKELRKRIKDKIDVIQQK